MTYPREEEKNQSGVMRQSGRGGSQNIVCVLKIVTREVLEMIQMTEGDGMKCQVKSTRWLCLGPAESQDVFQGFLFFFFFSLMWRFLPRT